MHIILENTVSHMVPCRKAVTAFCHDRPIIFFNALCDPAVTLSVAYRQYIQRRNCQRRPAIRTLFVTLLQKQRQSQLFCHNRPIIFFITLCDPDVALSVAYRQYIQRRNCQRRPAVRTLFVTLLQKQGQSQLFAMTALSFSLLLCATPPLHYLLPIGNISKGGIVSGDPPSGLCLSLYCKKQGQSQLFAMTALSSSLLLCVTPPLHYLLPIGNISKGGIVSGDPPH